MPTVGEQQWDRLTRRPIYRFWLLSRTNLFPSVNAFAHRGMNRFCIGGRGLVDRDIQKTDRIAWQHLSCLRDHHIFVLPTHAAHSQPDNFIGSESRGTPYCSDSTNHLYRIKI